MSGMSVMTDLAAAFMSAKALLSFGLAHSYLVANFWDCQLDTEKLGVTGREGQSILCEGATIDPDDDPGIGEQVIWLLELLHVLESVDRVA
jgi:hypothetical protein